MSTTPADRTDENLSERVTNSLGLTGRKIYYRIPLGFFTSLGLVNFPHKIDSRFLFKLENNLNRIFETLRTCQHTRLTRCVDHRS